MCNNKNNIIGILAYIAPELLNGSKPYTLASDIYSFGVLMSVISTSQQPFNNHSNNLNLATKICEGERPGFSINTPKFYIKLARKCMDADPDKRPTAEGVYEIINHWYISFHTQNFDESKSIKKEFDEMDKIKPSPSTITKTTSQNTIYTSSILSKVINLPQPVNSSKVTIIDNNNGN